MEGLGGKCDAKDIMRSLLRQLTVKNEETFEIVEQVHLEFKRREAKGKVGMGTVDKLEPHECTHWILELLQSSQAVILIDAIDEIDLADRHLLMKELIKLRDDPNRVVKIFLSSRDDTNLAQWLRDVPELHVKTALTQDDMQHFVRHCVSSAIDNKHLLDGSADPNLQSELEAYFLKRANGMFRWVELQLRYFCDLKSKHSIEQAMRNHTGASIQALDDLYATIFTRIRETDPSAYEIALQAFRLMLCAHEPLSPSALLAAASIARNGTRYSLEASELLRICSHLVIHDDELDTLQFSHTSVREYLARLPDFATGKANSTAAWSCLTRCIENSSPDLSKGVHPARDFDVYAAMYWATHYTATSEHDRDTALEAALKELLLAEEIMAPFPSWIETVDEISKALPSHHTLLRDLVAMKSHSMTPLFTACIYGFEAVVDSLSTLESWEINEKNNLGYTGIYLASAAGQTGVVERMLKLGADITLECGRQTTPLQAACANGHGATVQLILGLSGHHISTEAVNSAVQMALRSGHEDIAVLIMQQDNLSVSQDIYDQAFEAAAAMGFAGLMEYLHQTSKVVDQNKKMLAKGAEKTYHDGKITRFRTYFENKPLPDDALATAAFYGQNEVVKFCLAKGLDIEEEGPFGTPLRAASLMGHDSTVRMLLDQDANIEAVGSFGDALQAAAMRGHLSILKTLIHFGANVDNFSGYYGTALQAASFRGHVPIVRALIAAGAKIGQRGFFDDAVSAAVSGGYQDVVSLLIQSGYQSYRFENEDKARRASAMYSLGPPPSHVDLLSTPNAPDAYAWLQDDHRLHDIDRSKLAQLQDPSFKDAYESIQSGISIGRAVDLPAIKAAERLGPHALLIATTTGQLPIIQSMLECRDTIGVRAHGLGQILQAASVVGHLEIVEYVLALTDVPKEDIPRSLECAAWYGHIPIVERLLEFEEAYGPPPTSGYDPFTPKGRRFCDSKWMSDSETVAWSDYFLTTFSGVDQLNETSANGHILRILLQGCRGDAPATVELALTLAHGSGLQNLFSAALPVAIKSNSARALEVLFRFEPGSDSVVVQNACAQAEKHEALSALYYLLQQQGAEAYDFQDYWEVFEGASRAQHTKLLLYLINRILRSQEDSLLEEKFVEAAQGGHNLAIETWDQRVRKFGRYPQIVCQALDQACANSHVGMVSYLIDRGADVNTLVEKPQEPYSLDTEDQRSGDTYFRNMEIWRKRWGVLREDGRDDALKKQSWPRTALHACFQGIPQCDRIGGLGGGTFKSFRDTKAEFLARHGETVQLLLHNNANVNTIDPHGRSAMHYAALLCPLATVQALLDSGSHSSSTDNYGKTPLAYAAWREIDSFPVVQLLIKAGAIVSEAKELLEAALSIFRFRGVFIESVSVHQVLTTGPGATIRWLLQSNSKLQAERQEFGLLLQMASADGDADLVRLLIERNVDIKVNSYHYGTALHAAAELGHINCLKLLVEAGADVNLPAGRSGFTPLRAAVQGQHTAVVQILLEAGADMRSFDSATGQVPLRSNFKCPMLTFACGTGNVELVQLLLLHSRETNSLLSVPQKQHPIFSDVSSALHRACSKGHSQVVALLLEHGADPDSQTESSRSPLTTAADIGDVELMKMLLAAGAVLYDAKRDINVLRTLVIREGPKKATDFVLTQLLGTQDFIAACKECPSFMRTWQEDASFALTVDTMQVTKDLFEHLAALGAQHTIGMLQEGSSDMADVSHANYQALQAAAYFQKYELLSVLLSKESDILLPSSKYDLLIYAALDGLMPPTFTRKESLCCEVWASDSYRYPWFDGNSKKCTCPDARTTATTAIKQLLEITNADVNSSIGMWGTPLHIASYLGMLQLVKHLVSVGADVNMQVGRFGSALVAALKGNSSEVVNYLLQQDIDVNPKPTKHGTPLYFACKSRNMELFQSLLRRGAHMDESTSVNGTALHMACENKDYEMAEILLENGAGVNVCVPKLGTPVHIACGGRDAKMLSMLVKFKADVDIVSPDRGAGLHILATGRNCDMATTLLQHGANVNIFSAKHGTPLHMACQDHDDTMTRLLVKHGANVNSRGIQGESLLSFMLSKSRRYAFEWHIGALLEAEQQLEMNEEDLKILVASSPKPSVFQRLMDDNRHLQPTIDMVQSVIPRYDYMESDILPLLLARAPQLEIPMEVIMKAKSVGTLKVLMQHGSKLEVTADLMDALADGADLNIIKYLVETAPQVQPPASIITAVTNLPPPLKSDETIGRFYIDPAYEKRRYSEQVALAKEIVDLIVTHHPDIELSPASTTEESPRMTDAHL
ncbi:ankyrin repeat-containing domain protein [Paraphoma chrysanthemicola]|uniref:Ankyrin repeat-containing domain protein n=1 Tax=Paraphoma chrysanthemicola TaxID=798071 RepID=A0A8K0R6M2_9PLEO|nr:ankyrin repeat-containing domain protein [Paraphoma chrysanthemicola]